MIYANVFPDLDALRDVNGAIIQDKQTAVVSSIDGSPSSALWCFNAGQLGTDDGLLLVTPTRNASFGSWLRSDSFAKLTFDVTTTMPNNTVLYTVPAPMGFAVIKTALRILTPFTGLASASIGINSNISLVAGGLGTVVGGLAAPVNAYRGAQGTEVGTPRRSFLKSGDVLQHNVIAPGYTGGTGRWVIVGAIF